jgi:hypothetical protein
MDGLVAIVWNLITETNGAPEAVWDAVREHVRTDPGILIDAWDELVGLGAEARPHAKERVEQSRRLVNDVLLAVGDVARDRWRDLSPVARGLVVLVAREILEYRRGRRAAGRPPRVSPVTRSARRPRRPGRPL